jgi:hypothetical protein
LKEVPVMNPFMNYPFGKIGKEAAMINDEKLAQRNSHTIKNRTASGYWAWWLGNLMIRIGTKLTKENHPMRNANRIA